MQLPLDKIARVLGNHNEEVDSSVIQEFEMSNQSMEDIGNIGKLLKGPFRVGREGDEKSTSG